MMVSDNPFGTVVFFASTPPKKVYEMRQRWSDTINDQRIMNRWIREIGEFNITRMEETIEEWLLKNNKKKK